MIDLYKEVGTFLNRNKGLVKLGVAVSGGQDSMALLEALATTIKDKGLKITLVVIHCNHGWREDAGDNASHVCKYADKYGADIYMKVWENPKKDEGSARKWRMQCFKEATNKLGLDGICTGHTYTDKIETILYKLIRGTSPSSFFGMREKTDFEGFTIYRPLLNSHRTDTNLHCFCKEVEIWEDSTNQDLSFARNRIRHKVMPQLSFINLQSMLHIDIFSSLVTEDSDYLDSIAEAHLPNGKDLMNAIPLDVVRFEPNPIARRVVAIVGFKVLGRPLSYKEITSLVSFIKKGDEGNRSNHIRGGWYCQIDELYVFVKPLDK
jgi:tRNA(Ile)-lysidine synthase